MPVVTQLMPLPEAEMPQGHKSPGMRQAPTPAPEGHSLLQALLYQSFLGKAASFSFLCCRHTTLVLGRDWHIQKKGD